MERKTKLYLRLSGGLGNQLFMYAYAYAFSKKNNFTLLIDNKTGFERDFRYQRKYELSYFHISANVCDPFKHLFGMKRIWRLVLSRHSNNCEMENKYYFSDKDCKFLESPLFTKLNKSKNSIYFDGYWQRPQFFDIYSEQLKKEFKLQIDTSSCDKKLENNAIALHVRHFANTFQQSYIEDVSNAYYLKAITHMLENVTNPTFYIFSDNPNLAFEKIKRLTQKINHLNIKLIQIFDKDMILNFYLMSKCNHHIISYSTFSWWSAWLCENKNQIVCIPAPSEKGNLSTWPKELILEKWNKI